MPTSRLRVPFLHDGQAADRAAAHQVRGLPDRHVRAGRHDLRRHQLGDAVLLAEVVLIGHTEVALREHAHELRVVLDDEVPDALELHGIERDLRVLLTVDRLHMAGHHVLDAHETSSGEFMNPPA